MSSSGRGRRLQKLRPLTDSESAPVPSRPNVNHRFFHAEEILRPQDVIKHLAKGQQHWRKGYSAFALAHCWIASGGIPVRVRAALDPTMMPN